MILDDKNRFFKVERVSLKLFGFIAFAWFLFLGCAAPNTQVQIQSLHEIKKGRIFVLAKGDERENQTIKSIIEKNLVKSGFQLSNENQADLIAVFEWEVTGPHTQMETTEVPIYTNVPDPLRGGEVKRITGFQSKQAPHTTFKRIISIELHAASQFRTGGEGSLLWRGVGENDGISSKISAAAIDMVSDILAKLEKR